MLKRKKLRTRGKLPLSKVFQSFKPGDKVALVRELSLKSHFPKRMQGRTGVVLEQRGRSYVVEVKDLNMAKRFIVPPIHLKRIEQ